MKSLELAPNLFGFLNVSLIQHVIGHFEIDATCNYMTAVLGAPLLLLIFFTCIFKMLSAILELAVGTLVTEPLLGKLTIQVALLLLFLAAR